jgi:hypothetical protein
MGFSHRIAIAHLYSRGTCNHRFENAGMKQIVLALFVRPVLESGLYFNCRDRNARYKCALQFSVGEWRLQL